MQMIRAFAVAVAVAVLAPGDVALAQTEPGYRARVSTSTLYYTETATSVVDGNDPASPNDLLFTDLRGRAEAHHAGGTDWGGVGDFRLRATADDLSARGYLGGSEYQLREGFFDRDGESVRVALGRQVLREVAATRIDGASVLYRASSRWELGGFGGLYPNPLSRSLDDDYRGGAPIPATGGAWVAYRGERGWGSIAGGAVSPRDDSAGDTEPTRAFVTSAGYLRATDDLDLFHHVLADLAGGGGAQLLDAQLGASWRLGARLRLELAYAHMSTYALEIYVRDLLETADPDAEPGAPIQNNLAVVRIGSDEGRAGFNVELPARFNVHAELRARQRGALADAELPMEIAGLGADRQLDASAGVRQRDALLGADLAADIVAIRGDRTRSQFAIARARRGWLDARLSVELEASYVGYEDRCDVAAGDPTCTGGVDGRTIRGGGLILLAPNRRWLVLADYRIGHNRAEREGVGQPAIVSHAVFVRGQYTF